MKFNSIIKNVVAAIENAKLKPILNPVTTTNSFYRQHKTSYPTTVSSSPYVHMLYMKSQSTLPCQVVDDSGKVIGEYSKQDAMKAKFRYSPRGDSIFLVWNYTRL